MTDFLTAEMEVAYATAPPDVVVLHTIELNHPEFDDPVRLVANSEDDVTVTLEADAPVDPSTSVTFTAVPFTFLEPGYDDDGPTPARVRIDNVSGTIASIMKLTRAGDSAVSVIYRGYRSDGLTVPGQVIRGLELKRVRITATAAEGEVSFPDIETQNFPAAVYDIDNYPALFAA